eukprot:gene7650-8453_t
MGGCYSINLRYETFKQSFIASFFAENDLTTLFQQCEIIKSEKGQTMNLFINSEIAFYIIISGEVILSLSSSTRPAMKAEIFYPGDSIVFLPQFTYSSSGQLTCGKVNASYTLRSKDSIGEILYMNRTTFLSFLSSRSFGDNALSFLCNPVIDILSPLLPLSGFDSMILSDLQLLFIIMKLRRVESGQIITLSDKCEEEEDDILEGDTSSRRQQKHIYYYDLSRKLTTPVIPSNSVGMLMTGLCSCLPEGVNINEAITLINEGELPASRVSSLSDPEKNYSLSQDASLLETLKTQRVYRGSVFGFENFFIDNNPIRPDSVIAIEQSIVGHTSARALKILFIMNSHARRALRRNYQRRVMDSVRQQMPIFSDLEEDVYKALCQRITLKGIAAGEKIFTKGEACHYAYIIIHGLVEENSYTVPKHLFQASPTASPMIAERSLLPTANMALQRTSNFINALNSSLMGVLHPSASSTGSPPSNTAPLNKQSHSESVTNGTSSDPHSPGTLNGDVRYLASGSLFGEVSLVTDSPYFSNTQAMESTVLACISRQSLDMIYNENKAKIAALHIRVAGNAVDLDDFLGYPDANAIFTAFCDKEHSAENISFYNAAVKYEAMFDRMRYYILHSVPVNLWEKVADYNIAYAHQLSQEGESVVEEGGECLLYSTTDQFENTSLNAGDSSVIYEDTGNGSLSATVGISGRVTIEDDATLDSVAFGTIFKKPSNGQLASNVSQVSRNTASVGSAPIRSVGSSTPGTTTVLPSFINGRSPSVSLGKVLPSTGSRGVGFPAIPSPQIHSPIQAFGDINKPSGNLPLLASRSTARTLSAVSSRKASMRINSRLLSLANDPSSPDLLGENCRNPSGVTVSHSAPTISTISSIEENGKAPLPILPIFNEVNKSKMQVQPILEGVVDIGRESMEDKPRKTKRGSLRSHRSVVSSAASIGSDLEFNRPSEHEPLGHELSAMMYDIQQTLEKQFKDLREVARTIVEKHIQRNAEQEVNLPDSIRQTTLTNYNQYKDQSIYLSISQVFSNMVYKYVNKLESVCHPPPPEQIIRGWTIFRTAKDEIFKLMKKDSYMRFKQSKDFQAFIKTMKPYKHEDNINSVEMTTTMTAPRINASVSQSMDNNAITSMRRPGGLSLAQNENSIAGVSPHHGSSNTGTVHMYVCSNSVDHSSSKSNRSVSISRSRLSDRRSGAPLPKSAPIDLFTVSDTNNNSTHTGNVSTSITYHSNNTSPLVPRSDNQSSTFREMNNDQGIAIFEKP